MMIRKILPILAMALFANAPALAQTQTQTAATVTHLSGTLSVKKADGSTRLLGIQSQVGNGDLLSTEADTYARLKFQDGSEVVLRPNTQFRVERFSYDDAKPDSDNMLVRLLKGGMRSVTGLLGKRNPDKVSVQTPTATIGIRGTHFGLLFCSNDCASVPGISGTPPENGLHVDVADGAVLVSNSAGNQLLSAGQFGFVRNANTAPIPVDAAQGIRVTMPPSISQNNAAGKSIGGGGANACGIK